MAKTIATVKLAPGEIGYYDDLSKLYLTMGSPVGRVYEDMNHSMIRQAIVKGQLELVAGTFIPATTTNITVEDFKTLSVNKTPELIQQAAEAVYINENETETKKSKKKKTTKRKKKE